MKVDIKEIKELLPESQAFEIERGKRYLFCLDRPLKPEHRLALQRDLENAAALEGVRLLVLGFVPKIFLLEPEQ
jgi:hypothetical protein